MLFCRNRTFIKGTLILTLTGLLSRVIGFFYRIYLSRLFGEEGMGIYQLLSPVLALSFSLCAAGIQTAISKYVAASVAKGNCKDSYRYLFYRFVSFPASLRSLHASSADVFGFCRRTFSFRGKDGFHAAYHRPVHPCRCRTFLY